jgi:hypothetical protein
MHVETPFNRRDHRDADIQKILENLDALIMHLAPHRGIGDIPE